MDFLNYEKERNLYVRINRALRKRGMHIDPEMFGYWVKQESMNPNCHYEVYVGYAIDDTRHIYDMLDIACVAVYPFGVWLVDNPFEWSRRPKDHRLMVARENKG